MSTREIPEDLLWREAEHVGHAFEHCGVRPDAWLGRHVENHYCATCDRYYEKELTHALRQRAA